MCLDETFWMAEICADWTLSSQFFDSVLDELPKRSGNQMRLDHLPSWHSFDEKLRYLED
jgi:hypothetical protein